MSNSNKSTPSKSKSIYDQIGGEKRILDACRTFVARLAKDSRTSKAFSSLDQTKQAKHLSGFIAHVTGGPAFTGPSMYEYHRDLALNEGHFDAYLELLEETLLDCDYSQSAIQTILKAVKQQRTEVLGTDKRCTFALCYKQCVNCCDTDNVYVQAAGATLAVGVVALAGFYLFKALRKQ